MNPTPFEIAVRQLPVDPPVPATIIRTLDIIHQMILGEDSWQGSCHLSTTVAHILLAEQGIESTPCIGDLASAFGPCDHSWLEILGNVYDLSISRPNDGLEHTTRSPVIAGWHIGEGERTDLIYGASPASYGGNVTLDDPAFMWLKQASLTEFLDAAESQDLDLWFFVLTFGKRVGLELDRQALRQKYATVYRTIRNTAVVPPQMVRRWTIVRPPFGFN